MYLGVSCVLSILIKIRKLGMACTPTYECMYFTYYSRYSSSLHSGEEYTRCFRLLQFTLDPEVRTPHCLRTARSAVPPFCSRSAARVTPGSGR